MPNIDDSCKFILDEIGTLGVNKYFLNAPLNITVGHCVVNYLPQNRGDLLSTNVINVNLYIPKLNGQHDSSTIFTQYELIKSRLEAYTSGNARLGYTGIQILSEPFLGDLEGTDFSILNTRVTLTNNL